MRVDDVVLTPQGALLVVGDGTLVVADLHVGYEDAGRRIGAGLPPGPSPAEAVEAAAEWLSGEGATAAAEARVSRIVVNGDVKHSFAPAIAQARAVRALHERLAQIAPVVYVRGNHDTGLDAILPGADVVEAARAGRYAIAHGHLPLPRGPAVLGHEHPAFTLRDAVGAGLRARAFLRIGDRWILPALSPWAAGVDVRARGFASPGLRKENPDEAEAFLLAEGEVLGFGRLGDLARAKLL